MADREYQERYCAYVDILGFRDLITSLEKDTSKVHSLSKILATIHRPPLKGAELVTDADLANDFRAQSISDAVAISAVATIEGLLQLFTSLQSFTMRLLSDGYLTRGAAAKGHLYHDEKMVFGEALVQMSSFKRH